MAAPSSSISITGIEAIHILYSHNIDFYAEVQQTCPGRFARQRIMDAFDKKEIRLTVRLSSHDDLNTVTLVSSESSPLVNSANCIVFVTDVMIITNSFSNMKELH